MQHNRSSVMVGFVACLLFFAGRAPLAAAELANTLLIPSELTDLSGFPNGLRTNRLGGFMSDLAYDRVHDVYYGVTDRGPGGGLVSYLPRMQKFHVDVDPATGAVGNFQLLDTLLLATADGSQHYDGLLPHLLGGSASVLGRSLDPEGLVFGRNGTFFIADEYGPVLYEFTPAATAVGNEARFVRALNVPANLVPRDNTGQVNHVAERQTSPALVSGRQDNRGFEGLAISPDGATLFAAMQDPLAEEGSSSQGRNSRNVRIVRFDVATGAATGQFIYELDSRNDINARIPGTNADFAANRQGRDIGISSLLALNDHELLVLERDSRGLNPDNPIGADAVQSAVGLKRVYQIDLASATDVSTTSLAGTNSLPFGVVPVTKSLLVDIQVALLAAGEPIPERMEGMAVGPRLANGQYALLIGTDNDFSASDTADVYTDGTTGPFDGDPLGRTLLPTRLYSFRVDLPTYVEPVQVPEPSGTAFIAVLTLSLTLGMLRFRESRRSQLGQ